MIDLYDELKGILADLHREGVEYALCGGTARAVHGLPRATVDVDMLVPEQSLEPAKAVLSRRGYSLSAGPMEPASGAVVISRPTRVDAGSEDYLSVDLLHLTP